MRRLVYMRQWRSRLIFFGGAIAVGAVAALFVRLTEWAIHAHALLAARAPFATMVVTVAAMVLLSVATRRWFPGTEGSGIPQAIAALDVESRAQRKRLLSLRIAAGKIGLTTLGLLAGASIGREGPTVHVGAAIMDALGRWMHVPYHAMQRSLILAGGAAGVAAAFNTPIAGIVFAVEEMARTLEDRATGTVITSVLLAGVVSVGLLGNYVYFGRSTVELATAQSWLAVPLCGVVSGVLGGLFSRTLLVSTERLKPLLQHRRVAVIAALGGLIGLIGLVSHGNTYGSGYFEARQLLAGDHSAIGLLFPLLKFVATLASYLTGIPGGIFSPALATGVGIGADLAALFPHLPATALMVLAMVGYFAGVTQAPMTGAVIVSEMVDDHALILPILASGFIASAVSKLFCRHAVYHALAQSFRDVGKPPPADAQFEASAPADTSLDPSSSDGSRP